MKDDPVRTASWDPPSGLGSQKCSQHGGTMKLRISEAAHSLDGLAPAQESGGPKTVLAHKHPRARVCLLSLGLSTVAIVGLTGSSDHKTSESSQNDPQTLRRLASSVKFCPQLSTSISDQHRRTIIDGEGISAASIPQSSKTIVHHRSAPILSYSDLPLTFESYDGETTVQNRYVAAGRGYRLSLLQNEAVLDLIAPSKSIEKDTMSHTGGRSVGFRSEMFRTEPHSVARNTSLHMRMVGANPAPQVLGLAVMPGRTNYFKGHQPSSWQTNVANYSRVQYHDIYPGVDLLYYGNQHELEYDFVVTPGADPNEIRFEVTGARRIQLDAEGNLLFATTTGEVLMRKPLVYQQVGGERREIAGNFHLAEPYQIGVAVSVYDATLPLIIDPALDYATYLGRSVNDRVNAIAVGPDGSTYVAGVAPAPTPSGLDEAFVAHIAADGKTLLNMAYFGGSGATTARGIAVDGTCSAFITGETKAADFPVLNALQAACSLNASRQCAGDVYIAKLNPDGSLNFATYLGGSEEDTGNAITLDSAGDVYVAGSTTSMDFPIFRAAQSSTSGNGDAFIAKISGDGMHVLYATYLGGREKDEARAIAVDALGNVYVTGQTSSLDFPTVKALQERCRLTPSSRCLGEAFVAKLAADGSSLVYSTYLGGSSGDAGNAIAVDAPGAAYVVGTTLSADFPVVGPLEAQPQGKSEAFVAKLAPDGSNLLYSTFLGGSGDDDANSIAVDRRGNAYISGHTTSSDFPTQTPFQATCKKDSTGACSQDAFLAVLNSNGTHLDFATYLGGTGADEGRGVALDAKGSVYLGGATTSADFPLAKRAQALAFNSTLSPNTTSALSQAAVSGPSGGGIVAKVSGLGLAPQQACAGTESITWTGGAGDSLWTSVNNWDKSGSHVLPASTDTVCIDTGFSAVTITIGTISSSTNQSIASLLSNANIIVTQGPLTVSGTATFVNALTISSGTLILAGTSSVGTTMTQSSGTLAGTGALTVTGLFPWSGGTQCTGISGITCVTGTPNATTTANGGISFPSTSSPRLNGRTLVNNGTATKTGTANGMSMLNGAQVNNPTNSVWDFQNDSSIQNGGGTGQAFNNNGGTFRKSGGTGVSTVNTPIAFNNTGAVQVTAGTLNFGGGGSCAGTCGGSWAVGSGTTLGFTLGTYALSGSVSGAGTVNFVGGTETLTGTDNIKSGTTASGCTANFTAPGTVTSVGPLTISGGVLNFSTGGAISTTAMTQSGGTLAGTDSLTINGPFTWSVGTQCTGISGTTCVAGSPNATTTANGGISFPSTSSPRLDGRTLVNNGTATRTGAAGAMTMLNGAQVNNPTNSVWDFQNDSPITNGGGTGQAFNNNGGTFKKSGGTGTSTISNLTFTNTGTVLAASGSLFFNSGTYIQTAGTTTINGGSIVFPSPQMNLQGGTLNGVHPVTPPAITGNVSNSAGIVHPGLSPGILNQTGTYAQGASGAFNVDIGGTTAGSGFSQLNSSGAVTLDGTLNVTLVNGFNPSSGQSFNIMTMGSRSGQFATTNLPALSGGMTWTVTYNSASVVLSIGVTTPASITATSGTPQSATINTAFAAPLVATVKDAGGNPVAGVTVTFGVPGSGASGSFAGGVNTATTNGSGVATSATFTANNVAGGPYTVTASVAGV